MTRALSERISHVSATLPAPFALHVPHVRLRQAMKSYKGRLQNFGREIPNDRGEQVSETLLLARSTLMEFRLMEAVRMATMDLEEGKRLIKLQTQPSHLEKCKIQPLVHIHKEIWKASSSVMKGKVVAVK